MTEPLYKAIFKLTFRNATGKRPRDTHDAMLLIARIQEWLAANDRGNHYLMAYSNMSDDALEGEFVVVLNDQTTAIMLKLALG